MNYKEEKYHSHTIRGPIPKDFSNSIAFIGAAQTYGRFADKPFPNLVCDKLGMECLNLGKAGAGPEDPLFNDPDVFVDILECKAVVIQIMSGRSVSNWQFKIHEGQEGWSKKYGYINGEGFWKKLIESGDEYVSTIFETRRKYKVGYDNLIHPLCLYSDVILLYVSDGPPNNYEKDCKNLPYKEILGNFPHLITEFLVTNISEKYKLPLIKYYNRPGLPHPLPQRPLDNYHEKLGNQVDTSINNYYPSPQMHEEISDLLVKELKCVLES
jgi:hypothetical protein